MEQQLTYETIEEMDLEPGALVVVTRSEGSLPVVLEGFMSGLGRAFPDNTFVLLPPGMKMEQMAGKDLRELIEGADEPRTSPLAYKIKSNGRSLDTKVIAPDGKMVGHVQEMHLVAKASDPLVRAKLLKVKMEEGEGISQRIVTVEPQMIALNAKIDAEAVEIEENPLTEPPFIYVASSWRNEFQPEVVQALRREGYDAYDFRHPTPKNTGFHWSEIDPDWKDWSPEKYREALDHPLAKEGFGTDARAMFQANIFVGVQPFGRSAAMEMGWAAGKGKPTILLLKDGEPELMVKMFDFICCDMDEVLEAIQIILGEKEG